MFWRVLVCSGGVLGRAALFYDMSSVLACTSVFWRVLACSGGFLGLFWGVLGCSMIC
jgi:hypothetical protein